MKYEPSSITVEGELKTKIVIGHFRVPPGLCVKTRLSAHPLMYGNDFSFTCKSGLLNETFTNTAIFIHEDEY